MEKVTLKVQGMSCGGCVNSVLNVLKPIDGISHVDVTLDPGQAVIEYDPTKTGVDTFKEAIEGAGYDVAS